MIDDEKLQELLGKASSLYNNGQYQGAIEAWQEALSVDPANQKAREGLRMASLLVGEWEPTATAPAEDAAPADSAAPDVSTLPPEEAEARLDVGLARIKQLLAERKFSEAMAGANSLKAVAPESEALHRLMEEAQHGLESSPLVDEHLTLARELLEQERYAEAEAECRKIFVIEARYPAGKALMQDIKERVQQSLQRAASQMGGMTVKLSLPQIPARKTAPPPDPPPAPPVPEEVAPAVQPEEPAIPVDAAASQEEVQARNLLDQAFEQAGVAETAGDGLPISDVKDDGESPFELSHGPAGPEIVEAKTVVAPTVRTVPKAGETPAASPRPEPAGPAAPPAKTAVPADPSAWEAELAQLNLKEGERGLLKGTGAKPGLVPAAESPDVDLMSLLDGDIGGPPPAPAKPETIAKAAPAGRPAVKRPAPEAGLHESITEAPAVREAPAARPRSPERPRPIPPASRGTGVVTKLFLLLLFLAGGGCAAWYFYLMPRMTTASAAAPAQLGAPPQGTPAGPDAAQAPIPTPIGGPSRPQPQDTGAQPGEAATAAPATTAGLAGPPVGTAPDPAGGSAATPAVTENFAPPSGPIKPDEAPRLSPAETRRRITVFTADGRRLMAQGKWREARAKFQAVLALDPANLDIKEMSDQVQAKIDDEQRLQNDMDSTKQLFQDKDYENALRKLYRLPRDRGLGDIDLFIRNAWFNWAVVQLKAGNSKDAINKLNEALTLDPDDAEALRLQEVAERYTAKAKDRVYYAFTDTLKLRVFNQR